MSKICYRIPSTVFKLCDDLLNIFEEYYGYSWVDGESKLRLTDEDVPFLTGLNMGAAVEGSGHVKDDAEELIEMIQKHGSVEIFVKEE